MQRRKLKREKLKSQNGLCSLCPKPLPARGAILDRLEAMPGYTADNPRVIGPTCDAEVQAKRNYG